MARVTSPVQVWNGKVGNLVFSKNYDTQYVKSRNRINKSNTQAQAEHRSLFGQLQNLGTVWLHAYVNRYFSGDRAKFQPYRQFIKRNWQTWNRVDLAWKVAIPFWDYGQFCKNRVLSDNNGVRCDFTFDKDFVERNFSSVPKTLSAEVLYISDFRNQHLMRFNVNLTQVVTGDYTVFFTLPGQIAKLSDLQSGATAILSMFFLEITDPASKEVKQVPFQNPIPQIADFTLFDKGEPTSVLYAVEIDDDPSGITVAVPAQAKSGDKVQLFYYAFNNMVLDKFTVLSGDITDNDIVDGAFTVKDSDIKIGVSYKAQQGGGGMEEVFITRNEPTQADAKLWVKLDAHVNQQGQSEAELYYKDANTWKQVKGEQGLSAYEIAKINGFTGSEDDWLKSLQGQNAVSAINPMGNYTDTVAYHKGDYVTASDGNAYVCLIDATLGKEPQTNPLLWQLIALRGAQGIQGERGERGYPGVSGGFINYDTKIELTGKLEFTTGSGTSATYFYTFNDEHTGNHYVQATKSGYTNQYNYVYLYAWHRDTPVTQENLSKAAIVAYTGNTTIGFTTNFAPIGAEYRVVARVSYYARGSYHYIVSCKAE